MASQNVSALSKRDLATNIRKDFNIFLMGYTRFELPYKVLYDFKIIGFIPDEDVSLMANALSDIDDTNVLSSLLENESEAYIESLEELNIASWVIIDIAEHAPMAITKNINIEDFTENSFSLENLWFDFFWYPDKTRTIRLFFDSVSGSVELSNFLNDLPCVDTIFIDGKQCRFNENGRCVLSIEQIHYLIELFQLPRECKVFATKKRPSYLTNILAKTGKTFENLFEEQLRDPTFAHASSRSNEKLYQVGDGTLEISIDPDGIGKVTCNFQSPKEIYLQLCQLSDNKIILIGCGDGGVAQEYLSFNANTTTNIWIESFEADNMKVNIYTE